MATLQEAVVRKFFETLRADETFDQSKIAKLETLLQSERKIKSDDLEAIFSFPEGGEVL